MKIMLKTKQPWTYKTDQQETLALNQEMDEVEQPEQRYPVRIRHRPNNDP